METDLTSAVDEAKRVQEQYQLQISSLTKDKTRAEAEVVHMAERVKDLEREMSERSVSWKPDLIADANQFKRSNTQFGLTRDYEPRVDELRRSHSRSPLR